ncbi:protein MLN51 [Sesamum alatum]|uniref:Protein MLN51 n=1 Tax=Sesamum alatum TaxID=300844 RepID=A0AAE2CMX0_9LAMI|nr:protein MLN51 [Sesamum alatum]
MAEEEIEYESDPEEAKLSLKMRRREASDDEQDGEGGGNRREKPPRRIDESDGESEGAAAEYEDELEEEEEYDLEEEYVEEEVEELDVEYEESGGVRGGDDVEVVAVERVEGEKEGAVTEELMEEKKAVNDEANKIGDENNNVPDGQHEEDRKEMEPFAVPTAGAFYMHDDRFRDNAGGRHRRTLGGRKLWESKDDRKWGHDKFEELTMQERHHEQPRRGSRGRYRGRGRNRATDRGYAQGNRSREFTNNVTLNNNNQSNAPKGVRGRGPRRYQPSYKNNNEAPITQNKQSGKLGEKHPHVSSGRTSEPVSNADPPRKQVASNLSITSPPFYPTGSSTKENSVPLKRDAQAGTIGRNGQQAVVDESFNTARSAATMRGKNIADSIGVDKLYIDDAPSAMDGKPSNAMQMSSSNSSSINPTQPQLRGFLRQVNYKVFRGILVKVVLIFAQASVFSSSRNVFQVEAQASSPPKAAGAMNAFESGELESTSESSQTKTALVAKGKGNMQGGGKGSFLYGGAQVMGASGSMVSGQNDQNFPAFLPVMQFGGQHPGGIGVPAVGMAFPGYVAQPQLGLGSSEMTWLPVLAGAAGALGATYCPPYITMDGSYNARPSGQTSSVSAASSKENNTAKVGNDWKPAQRPELANDDFGQRQKNPRRYTEMKFDQ